MPLINPVLPEALFGTAKDATGPHFGILPSLFSSDCFEMSAERAELLTVFDKRFAVVREGQRHKPVTGKPTPCDTK